MYVLQLAYFVKICQVAKGDSGFPLDCYAAETFEYISSRFEEAFIIHRSRIGNEL